MRLQAFVPRLRGSRSLALALLCFSCGVSSAATNAVPANPVTRIKKPGLKNCFRINPNLYRGAQPTAEGMRQLEALGVKTIVSLRAFHSDRDELAKTRLARERIRFNTWHPEDEDVVRFLRIVTDTNRAPVFVHCLHGSDRTGTMVAIYRMAVENWSKDEAIKEMTQGGFGYHRIWKNLVKYLRALDVEDLKRRAAKGK